MNFGTQKESRAYNLGFENGFKEGFKNGSKEGEANGKIIGYDLAVEELRLKFWKQFNAAQAKFKRLLIEQQESVAKWLFERSSHALRDKITFEQAPEVTKDYWSKQANDLLILLEEGLK